MLPPQPPVPNLRTCPWKELSAADHSRKLTDRKVRSLKNVFAETDGSSGAKGAIVMSPSTCKPSHFKACITAGASARLTPNFADLPRHSPQQIAVLPQKQERQHPTAQFLKSPPFGSTKTFTTCFALLLCRCPINSSTPSIKSIFEVASCTLFSPTSVILEFLQYRTASTGQFFVTGKVLPHPCCHRFITSVLNALRNFF